MILRQKQVGGEKKSRIGEFQVMLVLTIQIQLRSKVNWHLRPLSQRAHLPRTATRLGLCLLYLWQSQEWTETTRELLRPQFLYQKILRGCTYNEANFREIRFGR